MDMRVLQGNTRKLFRVYWYTNGKTIVLLTFPVFLFRTITVDQSETLKGIIFRLDTDENYMGMPRLLFVLILGCIGVLGVGCCAFLVTCWTQRKNGKNYYSFSLLSQKPEQRKLFEDDDDVDETELFRTPIKGKVLNICCPKNTNRTNFRK